VQKLPDFPEQMYSTPLILLSQPFAYNRRFSRRLAAATGNKTEVYRIILKLLDGTLKSRTRCAVFRG
jgi:hypothetical protein